MDRMEELKDKAQDLAQAGIAKSKHLVEVGKLKLSSANELEAIRKAYQEMGKLYYAERGMAPEPAYAALCEKVQASRNKIRENNETLQGMKPEADVVEAEFEDIEDISQEDFEPEEVEETE